jgi:acyl-CoA thioester hydrolase
MGLAVERLGSSSVVYRVGLFQGDPDGDGALACAEGRFVHVYVDNTDPARPVTPIPDLVREAVAPLVV